MKYTFFNSKPENAHNELKSFEQQGKEINALIKSVIQELVLVSHNTEQDQYLREKIYAYYILDRLRINIKKYYENKFEITEVLYADNNNK